MANNDLPQRRIAVIAIHGVADQERGATVQALAARSAAREYSTSNTVSAAFAQALASVMR
jgi:hypothetical protein